MRHLEIAKTIDEMIPPHPLNHVTTGECVEAMVLSIIFQKEVNPEWFHDNRLGNALDALNTAGLNSMYGKYEKEKGAIGQRPRSSSKSVSDYTIGFK